jgi:hypothetical protein
MGCSCLEYSKCANPIIRLNFNHFIRFYKSQMATLAQGLLDHKFMLWEMSTKFGGGKNLKFISSFARNTRSIVQSIMKLWYSLGFQNLHQYTPCHTQ